MGPGQFASLSVSIVQAALGDLETIRLSGDPERRPGKPVHLYGYNSNLGEV